MKRVIYKKKKEVIQITNEMLEAFDRLEINGARTKRQHEYGTVDPLPKASNPYDRSRPLLSYSKHAGRDQLSACGRAGMFALKNVFPDDISTLSLFDVVNSLFDLNRTIDVEKYGPYLNRFKFDINKST